MAAAHTPTTWFVTGASRGLGAATARAALQAGHRVVATARDAATVAAALPGADARLLAVPLDVTDPAQAAAAVQAALARFGRIDVLVNNAGYGELGPFEAQDAATAERQFATNVFGLLHVTRAVLPTMRAQRAGRVFNIASIGGIAGFEGAALYCASKFAVCGFSESLAPELAPFGIRVTAVEPGFFRTDFLEPTSVRWGDSAPADYAATAQALQATYTGYSGRQAGDPAKLGAALVRLAGEAKPPLHFVAGSDALGMARDKVAQLTGMLDRWADLSASTDH